MKITEYPKTKELSEDDVFLIGGPNSTKTINGVDLFTVLEEISTEEPWVAHRNHFRGKNLGSEFTTEQKAAIRNGSFKDLWVGDYWTINDKNWRIADMNYWFYYQDQVTPMPNHLVIVPDQDLGLSKWANTSNDKIPYYSSLARNFCQTTAKNVIINAFGQESLLKHSDYIVNAVSNSYPTGAIFENTDVELMTETMVFGTHQNGLMIEKATQSEQNQNASFYQLSLFRLNPKYIDISSQLNAYNNKTYVLRDISIESKMPSGFNKFYSCVGGHPANSLYIRPVFAIG